MLQYHGRPRDLNANAVRSGSSNTYHSGAVALISPEKEKQARLLSTESTCQINREKSRLQREEKIRINVSGKRYSLARKQLQLYPSSLLGDPIKREPFFDAENEELFFDRNQTAFECVFNFYSTQGKLIFPKRSLSGQLIADELYFFGVYKNLELDDKMFNLPLPRRLQRKKIITPKNIIQRILWQMCEIPDSSIFARILNFFSLLVILFAVFLACLETLPTVRSSWKSTNEIIDTPQNFSFSQSLMQRNGSSLHISNSTRYFILQAELFCIIWFTVELLFRFVVAPQKCKFVLRISNIVDFAAILPFYISLLASSGFRLPVYILKIIRISKIFLVLKMSRFVSIVKIVGKTITACLSDLWTIVFLTFIGTVLFGSIVYHCEEVDDRTRFRSIPDACWWAVVTITTLGYGDMIPRTFGKSRSLQGLILITKASEGCAVVCFLRSRSCYSIDLIK